MKKLLILLTLFVANAVQADIIGVRVSGGAFDYEVSGTIRDDASAANTIDVKTILGFEDKQETHGYVYIEHPVPVIPNVRLGITNITLAGTGNTGAGFTYNGQVFAGGQPITSSFDFSHQEVALYYEILDNIVSVDVGLNVKLFDGDISLASGAVSATSKFDGTVPMLYAGVAISLPLTGLSIEGDLSTISAGDAAFTDYLVRVKYTTDFMLGVEVGLRSITLDYEDTGANEYADVTVEGPYAAVSLNF